MPMPAPRRELEAISPQLDVCMEGDMLRVETDLPGVEPQNVECTLKDGVLTIRGERQETRREGEKGVRERKFGRFERRITMPDGIDEDSLEARFNNGVLTITAHMRPDVGQQRRIQIAGSQQAGSQQQATQQNQPQPSQQAITQGGGPSPSEKQQS